LTFWRAPKIWRLRPPGPARAAAFRGQDALAGACAGPDPRAGVSGELRCGLGGCALRGEHQQPSQQWHRHGGDIVGRPGIHDLTECSFPGGEITGQKNLGLDNSPNDCPSAYKPPHWGICPGGRQCSWGSISGAETCREHFVSPFPPVDHRRSTRRPIRSFRP
jgi:hypothetical protein